MNKGLSLEQKSVIMSPVATPIVERSERAVLLEQLREWQNTVKHARDVMARIQKRLAEIERATVESERVEIAA